MNAQTVQFKSRTFNVFFLHFCFQILTLLWDCCHFFFHLLPLSLYISHLPLFRSLSMCVSLSLSLSFSTSLDLYLSLFCVYTYIYIYVLWCYYLGQVWPLEVLLSGPSLFFTKHCLSKNTIKIGVSAHFFWKKKLRAQIWGVIIWAKLVISKMQSTWPR